MNEILDLSKRIEIETGTTLSDSEAREVNEIYSSLTENDDTEFRIFNNLNECVLWMYDDIGATRDLIIYLADRLLENNGEYTIAIGDILDDRYNLLSSGRVVVNLD